MMGGESHVELRADFPGGFPNSKSDAFVRDGRSNEQNELFDFCQQIFKLRKQHPALSIGKMIHYAPTWNDDTYKILKIHDDEKILIIANGTESETAVELSELENHMRSVNVLQDIVNGKETDWSPGDKPIVPAMFAKMFLLVE